MLLNWLPVGTVTEEDAALSESSSDSAEGCFSCGVLTHTTDQCQSLDESFPFLPPLLCSSSEEAGTRVNSAEVVSDDEFPAVFGARDIRQVVRRRASPPGGQTIGAAQDDRQHVPPALMVDRVSGKCKLGNVSRTVSTSPLTSDLSVKCTSEVKVPPQAASTQVVLPPATVAHTGTAAGTSTPFVSTPAPVVEQPGVHAKGFPTLRLVESPELLPSFGWSSPSPSPRYVGSSGGLVTALFAQPCIDGALTGCSGRGQFVQCVTAFTRTLLSASSGERIASGWRGPIAGDVG